MNIERITYKINETGYDIYLDGKPWITQYPPYIPHPELTLEECCLKQIEELCASNEETSNPETEDMEERILKLETSQADQDDAITELAEIVAEV